MEALLRAAIAVRGNAHAPYSRFPVGAAVLAEGRIYAGCNVENSSFPLSVCAERNAVAAAIAAGARGIQAVAVVAGTRRPGPPCGGCRQVLAEFCAAGTRVLYAAAGGGSVETTLGALLPEAFGAADLAAEDAAAGSMRAPRATPGGRPRAPRRRGSRSGGQ